MRPEATRKAPNTMLYALSTHDIVEVGEWGNEARMLGNATLTIVESRNARKAPKAAMRSTAEEVGALRWRGGVAIRLAIASSGPDSPVSLSAVTASRRTTTNYPRHNLPAARKTGPAGTPAARMLRGNTKSGQGEAP